jgi:SAM-dependent methyltransferase
MANDKWFESWFDTSYYHLLYNNRDASEAEKFVSNLISFLNPSADAFFCDLGCGVGRHAEVIANLGFKVLGLDLSTNNIEGAGLTSNDKLSFEVQDMRLPFGTDRFDFVLNLFTSFGYFDEDVDHYKTIKNIAQSLSPGGIVVIDYLNVGHVRQSLKIDSEEVIDGIKFEVRRLLSDRYVIKEIKVTDHDSVAYFEERVRLFCEDDFEEMFTASGLELIERFGDYNMNEFDLTESPRLILIAKKA